MTIDMNLVVMGLMALLTLCQIVESVLRILKK